MNNRKDVPAVMKKPKLKKVKRYHTEIMKTSYCWLGHDKCLVTVLSTWSTSKSEPVRRNVRGRK
jgi:hypothetical protein